MTPHSVKQTNTVLGFHRQVSTDFSRKSLLSLWLGHWGWGSAVTEANLLSKTHGACGEAEEDQAGDEQGGNRTHLHAYEFDVMLSAMRLSNLFKKPDNIIAAVKASLFLALGAEKSEELRQAIYDGSLKVPHKDALSNA